MFAGGCPRSALAFSVASQPRARRFASCIYFSLFWHTVGGRSPSSHSIQLGSSVIRNYGWLTISSLTLLPRTAPLNRWLPRIRDIHRRQPQSRALHGPSRSGSTWHLVSPPVASASRRHLTYRRWIRQRHWFRNATFWNLREQSQTTGLYTFNSVHLYVYRSKRVARSVK